MAWIELHQTLPRHPKLARFANRLRVTRAQAAGHLTFLWLWALDYAPNGDVSALEPAEISAAADFSGDAELFCQALRQSGWIDEDGRIHDWMEYAGRLVEQRMRDKERKKVGRAKEAPRPSDGCPADIQRTSSGIPPDGGRTADVPNPTQPNPTVTARPPDDLPVELPPRFPRSETEASAAADFVGCSREFAVSEWNRAVGRGGRDSKDVPIRDWRRYLSSALASSRSREAERGSGQRTGVQTPPNETREERERRMLREAMG